MVYSAEWFLDRRILWNTLYTSNSLCILSVFSEHSVTVPNFLAEISGMKFPSHSAEISRNFPLEVSLSQRPNLSTPTAPKSLAHSLSAPNPLTTLNPLRAPNSPNSHNGAQLIHSSPKTST